MSSPNKAPQYFQFTASDLDGNVIRHELKPERSVFIGSSSNCGFRLTGPDVSQIHCHLTQESGKLFVKDWMSAKGTRINGQSITEITPFGPSDSLEVGSFKINFRVVYPSIPYSDKSNAEYVENEISSRAFAKSESERLSHEPEIADPKLFSRSFSCEPTEEKAFAFDVDCFEFDEVEEEQTYDRETVALLRAEIEYLQATLAQRDADKITLPRELDDRLESIDLPSDVGDRMLKRMQELIEEANHSDERVALLEELLRAAEDANRSEQEERQQLEAWVGEIEARIAQREEEHTAELDALKHRLDEATDQQHRLELKLKQAAQSGNATSHFDETLESLQASNRSLQHELAKVRKERLAFEQRVEQLSTVNAEALQEERANIAKERAQLARMRYEISQKLSEVEVLPKSTTAADQESATRIQALRNHLREIHEQEKTEVRDNTLSTRLARLWKRVEYV